MCRFFVYRFNRGALINAGFLLTEFSFDYMAIHDVDLIPENPNITYSYPELGPYHLSAPGLHPKYNYEKFMGGILLITKEHFRAVSMLYRNYNLVYRYSSCDVSQLCFVLISNCFVLAYLKAAAFLGTCFHICQS